MAYFKIIFKAFLLLVNFTMHKNITVRRLTIATNNLDIRVKLLDVSDQINLVHRVAL